MILPLRFTMPIVAFALGVTLAVVATGCEGRTLGNTNHTFECWDLWECNPDLICGEMVNCLEGQCRPDLARVRIECPYDQCRSHDECMVAMPYDCCNGCPRVVDASELSGLPCFYELGTVPGDPPPECLIDCTACPVCFPQPLGAFCDLGRCDATGLGCAYQGTGAPPLVTTWELIQSPESYDGMEYRVRGTLLPGLSVCSDICPSPRCCQEDMLLDGAIRLQGSPCQLTLSFTTNDYCDDTFVSDGMLAGATYEVAGTLRLSHSPFVPFTMDVLGVTLAEHQGVEGAFDVFVTEVFSEATDPACGPPSLAVGNAGRVFLAESGGMLRVVAPMFDCWWDFVGAADGEGWFETQVPIDCDDCCCDYFFEGQVVGNQIYATYTSFDGTCRYEYWLSGTRDPAEHPAPPEHTMP